MDLRIDALASLLFHETCMSPYVDWESLPREAQEAFTWKAKVYAGVLAGDVASEMTNYRIVRVDK